MPRSTPPGCGSGGGTGACEGAGRTPSPLRRGRCAMRLQRRMRDALRHGIGPCLRCARPWGRPRGAGRRRPAGALQPERARVRRRGRAFELSPGEPQLPGVPRGHLDSRLPPREPRTGGAAARGVHRRGSGGGFAAGVVLPGAHGGGDPGERPDGGVRDRRAGPLPGLPGVGELRRAVDLLVHRMRWVQHAGAAHRGGGE